MATGLRLEQRLGQSLVMTPQLQQAIKLLQLSNLELQGYVEQELEKNPLLEAADSADLTGSDRLPSENASPLDADYENVYDADRSAGPAPATGDAVAYGSGGRSDFESTDSLEGTLTRPKSLREHIEEQMALATPDPTDRLISSHLIDQLDDSGYFIGDCEASASQLGCDVEPVERVLTMLQKCEPAGLFARSLSECLALQLADRGRLCEEMEILLDNLELVANRDLGTLAGLCELTEDDIVELVQELRTLDPKPGLSFENDVVQTLVPDVYVQPDAAGNWSVTLNSDTLPKVLVDNSYYAVVSRAARTREEKSYIQDSYQSANWLVRALDQRAQTILKVASELIRQQDGFLTKGVRYLRPLTLRDIADQVEMHESTISRVTSNKFMATPRGVFELKYFFSSSIPGTNGTAAHSAESVRHRIKELIENEPTDNVLSDDRLVAVLAGSGVEIARRTVAKYRESLHIPSSVQRRRQKSARI
jgi:RNA polymerase sigma-54 factor